MSQARVKSVCRTPSLEKAFNSCKLLSLLTVPCIRVWIYNNIITVRLLKRWNDEVLLILHAKQPRRQSKTWLEIFFQYFIHIRLFFCRFMYLALKYWQKREVDTSWWQSSPYYLPGLYNEIMLPCLYFFFFSSQVGSEELSLTA